MKIVNRYNRRARIVEEVQDLRQITLPGDNGTNYGTVDALPVYFVVKVEIKVALFWVTVYSESCDISDGDTRTYIINRAKTLCRKLEGKDDETGDRSISSKPKQYRKMEAALCRTCIAYRPDDDKPGFGTCIISGVLVCECARGCIDWRYYRIWRPRL